MNNKAVVRNVLHLMFGLLLLVPAAAVTDTQQRPVTLNPLPQPAHHLVTSRTSVVPGRPEAAEFAIRLQQAVELLRSQASVPTQSAGQVRATPVGSSVVPPKAALRKSGIRLSNSTSAAAAVQASTNRFVVRAGRRGLVRQVTPAAGNAYLARASARAGSVLETNERTAFQFFEQERALFGLEEPAKALQLKSAVSDALGHSHLRFDRRYKGLRVYGAQLITQFDRNGNLLSVNGAYSVPSRKFSTNPVVSIRQAEAAARNRIAVSGTADLVTPSELLVYIDHGEPRLTWLVRVDAGPTRLWSVFVDAITGNVLSAFNEVHTSSVSTVLTDLLGEQKAVNLWLEEPDADSYPDGFYAVDTTKAMFDVGSNPPDIESLGMIVVMNAFDQPPTSSPDHVPPVEVVGQATTDNFLADAVSALYSLSATYDYFDAVHGRNSIDGAGASMKAIVRFGQDLQNAFYLPEQQLMLFGTGDHYAAALDVVAHEITHGVISSTAGLVYQNQSGALNEAFADIFGEMAEARTDGAPDWILGTRLNAPIRNMADPATFSCGGVACPARMSEYVFTTADNGGVHFNSSIINHAFYLLAEGLPGGGIGTADAEQVFYRALTTKLVPLSEFLDLRFAAITSAEELFGAGSVQAQKTAEAFDAVEVFDAAPNPVPGPFPGTDGTEDSTLFIFFDTTSGLLFVGRRETALGDPPQGSFLSLIDARFARPSISGDGSFAAFVDSSNDLCLISTAVFGSEQCLQVPGLVHSVAMSPDANLFGFVFLDEFGNPTNKITVFDNQAQTQTTYQLAAPVLDGTTANEIVQADQMDITASGRYLFYDALNSIEVDGGVIGVWSIYALDLVTGATLVIVPPVLGLDIGYPSLAQTSDFHLTFDVLDAVAGINTVYAGDLLSGALQSLVQTTAEAIPSYTGDDGAIVFSQLDGTPTGASLFRIPMATDRITPAGPAELWLQDADFNAMYRRGSFTGPSSVDLAVTAAGNPGEVDVGDMPAYLVRVTNNSAESATDVELIIRHASGIELSSGPDGIGGTCSLVAEEAVCTGNLGPGETLQANAAFFARVEGSFPFSVSVAGEQNDPDGANNVGFFKFDVRNDSPVVSQSIPNQSGTVGRNFSFAAGSFFSDPNGESLAYAADVLPGGLELDPQTGTISGVPGTAGSTDVTVTATDASGASAEDTFSISISPPASSSPPGDAGGGGGRLDPMLLLALLQFVLFRNVAGRGRWSARHRSRPQFGANRPAHPAWRPGASAR